MLNAFRRSTKKHVRTQLRATATSLTCSTPFGDLRKNTGRFALALVRLPLVLNAFRRSTKKHIYLWRRSIVSGMCSTPFGDLRKNTSPSASIRHQPPCAQRLSAIYEKTRGAFAIATDILLVLNAFRRSTKKHVAHRMLMDWIGIVLNAFRRSTKKHFPAVRNNCCGVGLCSTPFGDLRKNTSRRTEFNRHTHVLNAFRRSTKKHVFCQSECQPLPKCSTPFGDLRKNTGCLHVCLSTSSSAQRLSAIYEKTPRLSQWTKHCDGCSTPFGDLRKNTRVRRCVVRT